jgi:hypothetical protein
MKYLYVILVIIIIYYIVSSLSENYSSSEHFDPSLVPVSSIVTLAKVAQKLVNTENTLINPGNLQIGMHSAPGNFTVTGNTTLGLPDTNTTINGITNMNSDTWINLNKKLNVGGGIYIREGNLVLGQPPPESTDSNYDRINMISDGTGGLYLSTNKYIDGPGIRLTTGNTTVNGNLSVRNTIEGIQGKEDKINNITFNYKEGIQISSKVNTHISSGGLIVDRLLQAPGNIQSPLLSNDARLKIISDTEDVYISGKNGVNIATNSHPDWKSSGNLNVEGKLCINGSCLSQDELLRLKMIFKISNYDEKIKGIVYCNLNTPDVLINGWLTARDHSATIVPKGEYPNAHNLSGRNITQIHHNNGDHVGRPISVTDIGDIMNYVYVYPGYGFRGWSNINYLNNNFSQTNPIICENNSKQIMYYAIWSGLDSSDSNINKYGINLHDMDAPKEPVDTTKPNLPTDPTKPNLWDQLSSFKVYELPYEKPPSTV